MYDKEVYHFLFLHFPIGLFITGFIFHVFYMFNHSVEVSDKLKEYIHWTMGMGIIWSVLSIITGFITALKLEYINSIFNISDKPHAYIMILSTILFSILFSLRNMDKKIFFILHLGSVILLIYGTHLGAKWADRI
tara:strand:+ start:231 stop:635 length:405 start_codon:yes stop_codon:yes gene_type:complete